MMLIIAFIAICIGCILLYSELKRFGDPFGNPPPWNTSGARVTYVVPHAGSELPAPRVS